MPKSLGSIVLSWKFLGVIFLLLGIIAAVVLIRGVNNLVNLAATPKVILNLVPNGVYLDKDESATLQVIINTQDISVISANIHLRFDPNIIAIDQIKGGKFLNRTNSTQINKDEAAISLSTEIPRNGLGILAEVRIRSLVKAPTEIVFSKATSVIPYNYAGNAVFQTYGAKIYDDESKVPKSIGNSTIPEGVVYTDPDSFIRQLTDPQTGDASLKQKEIKPGFSADYAKYLLSLPLRQIEKLNENLEGRIEKFIK